MRNHDFARLAIAAGLGVALVAAPAQAVLVDFEDEPAGNDDAPLDLATRDLGFATMTTTDFNQWSLSGSGRGISPYGATGSPSITFSSDVYVNSIEGWVSNSGHPAATITGTNNGVAVFSLVVAHDADNDGRPDRETWRSTGSSLLPVDAISFTNFADSHIDNIDVTAVPEPAALSVLGLGMLALVRRRRAA